MENKFWLTLRTIGICAGLILLFIIKYLALLIEYLFKRLKEVADSGLEQLKQKKEELDAINIETERLDS